MLIDKLKAYLKNTPFEQLEKEWDDLKEFANVGPTAAQLLESWENLYPDLPKVSMALITPVKIESKQETPKESEFFFTLYYGN
jgi:hypothetical protein